MDAFEIGVAAESLPLNLLLNKQFEDGWMDGQRERWMDGQMGGWIDTLMDRWVDGCMNGGWLDGKMNGRMDGLKAS